MDYRNKLILAPMVRMGTLPLRLLSLDYGADIVYGEEIVDWRMLSTRRVENEILNTIDYVNDTDGSVVFRTCSRERNRVVFQIGTSDAKRALEVALKIQDDVAAIDINMGCPKDFSIKGGMGAALLSQPEKIRDILTTLVKNVKKPVTCKIRILDNLDDTLTLCRMIQETGVAAIGVHGRKKEERPREDNHDDVLKAISKALQIPVIANGGSNNIQSYEDILSFKARTNAASVMVARAAQWNCSVFRRDGPLPLEEVIKAYVKYAIDYDSIIGNAKYCIQSMLRDQQDSDIGKQLLDCQALEDICRLWNMDSYYRQKQEEFRNRLSDNGLLLQSRGIKLSDEPLFKRFKLSLDSAQTVKTAPVVFHRGEVKKCEMLLPKTVLLNWTRKKGLDQPMYRTETVEKLFVSVVTVDGCTYGSSVGSKNKKYSEQAAAQVCLDFLGVNTSKSLQ